MSRKDVPSEYKTQAGTVLPILNLKGKAYLQVAHRLQWFVEENPTYDITTQFLKLDDNQAVAMATVVIHKEGRVLRKAVATKSETLKGFPDFIEKAETGALGRALAMLGYGTQFTGDELDEGDRLADSPVTAPSASRTVSVAQEQVSTSTTQEMDAPTSFRTRTRRGATAKTATPVNDDI